MNPKHLRNRTSTRLARRLASILVLASGLVVSAGAFGGEPGGREKYSFIQPVAGMSIGDETIGTLPIANNSGLVELHRGLPILRPSLFLEGDLFELSNLISFAGGSTRAEVVPLDPMWQRVRLVFVDEVLLAMDRLTVQGTDVQFGLWMPEPVAYAYPLLTFGDRQVSLLAPTESRLALPIRELSIAGALLDSTLEVQSLSFFGANSLLARSNADFLLLAQRQ